MDNFKALQDLKTFEELVMNQDDFSLTKRAKLATLPSLSTPIEFTKVVVKDVETA